LAHTHVRLMAMSSGSAAYVTIRLPCNHAPRTATYQSLLGSDVTFRHDDSQARTFEQGPPRLGRKSVFQSLQELADSEDTIQQQQGQRARPSEERNREHDRAAVHRWARRTCVNARTHRASLRLSICCLSAAFASVARDAK